jgi:hypothetical protein
MEKEDYNDVTYFALSMGSINGVQSGLDSWGGRDIQKAPVKTGMKQEVRLFRAKSSTE